MESVEEAVVEIRLFGGVDVVRPGGSAQLRSRLRRVLLAMLLAHRDEVVSATTLAASLWPDAPPAKWDKGLQVHVHRLRQALGDPGAVRYHPPGYRLAVPGDRVDAYRFEDLARQGQASLARGDPVAAAGQLRQALALYRGPAFQGLEHVPDLVVEAHRLAERRLVAIEHRIIADLATGEHASLVGELEALVSKNPMRERFRAQLMTALYRSGRKAEALAAYRAGRRILVAELGVEPNQECRALERAILADDPSLAAPPMVGAAGPAGSVPVMIPRQLPPDVAAFTGRTEQLAWLDDLLARSGPDRPTAAVISAVDGMAGVGKTALAVRWAHRVAHRFPDGQLYANLRGYSVGSALQPGELMARFLVDLGLPAEQVPADLDEAVGRYRSLLADRRVLVVLDNAASADQVRSLLPAGAGCAVVVTSRDQLAGLVAKDGAHRLAVDVLSPAESVALVSELLGADRVAAEPAAVAELAELCGHLPLALRIAAASVTTRPARPVAAHVERLRSGDRLAVLAVAGDDHATVATAFELSYRRLPRPVRRTFRLLALAPGPDVSAEAAAALAGTTPAQVGSVLEALASANLVEERSSGRYSCHDLLRQYAADRATDEEPEPAQVAARGRLYEFYLRTTDAAVRLLYPDTLRLPGPVAAGLPGFDRLPDALSWLDTERPNLAAVVVHTARHGPFPVAWRLADMLRQYLSARSLPVEGVAVAAAALSASRAAGEPRAEGNALISIAAARLQQSRYPVVAEHARRAFAVLAGTGWLDGQGAALTLLSAVSSHDGRLVEAVEHSRRALALHRRSGWRYGQALVLGTLGQTLTELGRLSEAARYAGQAATALSGLGSSVGEGVSLGILGDIRYLQGQLDQAWRCFLQARDRFRAAGGRVYEPDVLCGLAQVHRDAGRGRMALALAEAALAREPDRPGVVAHCLIVRASIHEWLGDRALAIDGYQRAADLAWSTGDRYGEAEALVGLAAVPPLPGGSERARTSVRRALTIAREAGYRLLEGRALTAVAGIDLAEGAVNEAMRSAARALAVHRQTGHRPGEAGTYLILGRARAATGDPVAAREHRRLALELYPPAVIPESATVIDS